MTNITSPFPTRFSRNEKSLICLSNLNNSIFRRNNVQDQIRKKISLRINLRDHPFLPLPERHCFCPLSPENRGKDEETESQPRPQSQRKISSWRKNLQTLLGIRSSSCELPKRKWKDTGPGMDSAKISRWPTTSMKTGLSFASSRQHYVWIIILNENSYILHENLPTRGKVAKALPLGQRRASSLSNKQRKDVAEKN